MKKFFTLLLAATCALGVSAKSSFTITALGEEVSDGDNIRIGYVVNEVIPGVVSMAKWDPELKLNTKNAPIKITVEANSDNKNAGLQCCAGGGCEAMVNGQFLKTFTANEAETDLVIDMEERLMGANATVKKEPFTATIKIFNTNDPSDGITFTLEVVDKPQSEVAGIANVASDANSIKVNGNQLVYNFATPTQLSVFGLLGQQVIDRTLSGNGTIELATLPQGIYMYRAGKISGKIMVR